MRSTRHAAAPPGWGGGEQRGTAAAGGTGGVPVQSTHIPLVVMVVEFCVIEPAQSVAITGLTGKPAVAYLIAGASTSASGRVPYCSWSMHHPMTACNV